LGNAKLRRTVFERFFAFISHLLSHILGDSIYAVKENNRHASV